MYLDLPPTGSQLCCHFDVCDVKEADASRGRLWMGAVCVSSFLKEVAGNVRFNLTWFARRSACTSGEPVGELSKLCFALPVYDLLNPL